MPRGTPELPSIDAIREILRGPPKDKGMKPTGRYFVSALTFRGLLLHVRAGDERVQVGADELSFEYEGRTWTVVRSTAIKKGVHVEYE